ncbi:hypothetical protein ScPMuIL_005423 [Solemya velum]
MADTIDFTEIHNAGGYGSEFEYDSEAERKKNQYQGLLPGKKKSDGVAHRKELEKEYSKEEGRTMRFHFLSMDAYARHKEMVNNYLRFYGGSKNQFQRDSSKDKTDMDTIRENHRFLWSEEEDSEDTWEKRLAKKYYDKLYKEYCITDLSRYKENKVAMRWRIEKEVNEGKGQFICGNKKCRETEGLRSWEVNFAYVEQEEKKNALVKLRLCPDCSYKLNYHHRKKEVLPKTRKRKRDKSERASKHTKTQHRVPVSETQEERHSGHPSDELGAAESEKSIWSGPAPVVEEKSREEEFEEYFEDMFL